MLVLLLLEVCVEHPSIKSNAAGLGGLFQDNAHAQLVMWASAGCLTHNSRKVQAASVALCIVAHMEGTAHSLNFLIVP